MRIYNGLFYLLYSILKSFEGGFSYQNNDTRALEVVMIISFLELFNLMSFFPTIVGRLIIVPLSIIFCVNYLIFYYQRRYKSLLESFKLNGISGIYNVVIVLYVGATMLFFWITR